ncbi:hypothetical protein HSX11_10370 [Oxalobacteraceae bacterium]|nr:hypothetical protein [Oxalobacteraceae bacterium]
MWMFEPTARLKDFDSLPGLREAWSAYISHQYETNLYGKAGDDTLSALEELRLWGRSDSDLRVYNPAAVPLLAGSTPRNVFWSALPTSFDSQFDNSRDKFTFLDAPQRYGQQLTRIQDEYCEWVVKRNAQGKISSVLFTSEPPEYYNFLFYHSSQARELLLALYRDITGVATIRMEDLLTPTGEYDWYNRYNNEFAVHMQQPNNTLGAQVNIVSIACLLRMNSLGKPLTDAQGLIHCGAYGDGARQSDPSIGAAINGLARENRFITLENPVGLYMAGINWAGWKTPDGKPARDYWTVLRGSEDVNDPAKSFIVRARYEVPSHLNYTVSDIKIGGEAIEFGGQIAAQLDVRVAVLVSEPAQVAAPRVIGCKGAQPVNLSDTPQRSLRHSRRGPV